MAAAAAITAAVITAIAAPMAATGIGPAAIA
jgi:hypothetical protein